MKSVIPVAIALVVSALTGTAAFAGDHSVRAEFYNNKDRSSPSAFGLAPITGRFPTVSHSVDGFNIPPGAQAPVPVNVLDIPHPYGFGETALPIRPRIVDAKGRATNDVKGRAAWDGAGGRMSFGQ